MDLKNFSKTRNYKPLFPALCSGSDLAFLWKFEGRSKCSTSIEVGLIDNSPLPKKKKKLFIFHLKRNYTSFTNFQVHKYGQRHQCKG